MKTKQWIAVLGTLVMIGFVYPFLFSAKSDIAVIGGALLVIAHVVVIVKMFKTQSVLIVMVAFASACSTVPAGHKGVKVYLLGGEKGVDHEVLGVGRYWIGVNEELYKYPTFTQNATWVRDGEDGDESIAFQTSEGLSVSGDFGITYHVEPDKISVLFQTFRRGIDEITDTFLRNMVRDALNEYASKLPVESVYGEGKSSLIDSVEKAVYRQVFERGIVIEKVYAINNFKLPDAVVAALNSKIEATQRAQQRENELREAEAQAKKQVAEAEGQARSIEVKAKAEAEANRIVSNSLTPTLVEYEKVKRWDGKLPQVTSGSGVLLNLK